MTKTTFTALLIVAVGLVPPSASAQQNTTEEMASACRPVVSAKVANETVAMPLTFEAGQCWGAFLSLQGVLTADVRIDQFFGICAPAQSTRTQFVAVFVRYADNHPEQLHTPFMETALASLKQAFPCRTAKSKSN